LFYLQVENIVGKEHGLNVLINNAGIAPTDVPLTDLTPDLMREGFEINCLAPLFLTKALLPLLKTAAEVNAGGRPGKNIGRAAAIQVSSKVL
jgi:NAD(P)-dependent dehydrogenase (short-subunit alcohol dehydrogenase family)